jgi:tetratricopeptide (TPR) repeat protein
MRNLSDALRLFRGGQYREAQRICRSVLAFEPRNAAAMELQGVVQAALGEQAEAIDSLQRAAGAAPNSPGLLYNFANVLRDSGRLAEAAEYYRRALLLRPAFAEAWMNLALTHHESGNVGEALDANQQAMALRPQDARTLFNHGNFLQAAGRPADAIGHYDKALQCRPDDPAIFYNRGNAQFACGQIADAVRSYEMALALKDDLVAAWLSLGRARAALKMLPAAIDAYRHALALDPQLPGAHYNLASALQEAGAEAEALSHYDRALTLKPGMHPDAQARLNYALASLAQGRFDTGWVAFEARLEVRQSVSLAAAPPGRRWSGVLTPGTQVLIVAEQGFGDAIQFARYGSLLREHGIRATLQCDAALTALLGSADLFERVAPHTESLLSENGVWWPLMSLPLLFNTGAADIPAWPRYLKPDPRLFEHWGVRLGKQPLLRVGIAWQGNPDSEKTALRGRSIPVSFFMSLARVPGVQLVSLQKGRGAEQLPGCAEGERVLSFGEGLDSGPDAFVDTAALMMHLDLVITSDTAVAHLAGALGVPVWVALHTSADWRWLRDRSDSPWYPSMRLYRQVHPGEWGPVFEAIARDLVCMPSRKSSHS